MDIRSCGKFGRIVGAAGFLGSQFAAALRSADAHTAHGVQSREGTGERATAPDIDI